MTPLRKILEEVEARARLGEDKEADYFSENIAIKQILELIPKKREEVVNEGFKCFDDPIDIKDCDIENCSHKGKKEDCKDYREVIYDDLSAITWNQAISETAQSMTGER